MEQFSKPWKITDNGSAFHVRDANGRGLAYVYYKLASGHYDYLTKEEAREMAKAIARLSRTGDAKK
jgi:hypothetical protein